MFQPVAIAVPLLAVFATCADRQPGRGGGWRALFLATAIGLPIVATLSGPD
jgi:hypothetical protein